jgi:hypothetical protein
MPLAADQGLEGYAVAPAILEAMDSSLLVLMADQVAEAA